MSTTYQFEKYLSIFDTKHLVGSTVDECHFSCQNFQANASNITHQRIIQAKMLVLVVQDCSEIPMASQARGLVNELVRLKPGKAHFLTQDLVFNW